MCCDEKMFLKQVAEGNGHAKLELVAKLGAGYDIIWGKKRSLLQVKMLLPLARFVPSGGPRA